MLIAALMLGTGLGSFVIGPLRESYPFETLYRFSAAYPVLLVAIALPLAAKSRIPA